jgi:hypothetical protein
MADSKGTIVRVLPARATVTRRFPGQDEEVHEEDLAVHEFITEPAKVEVKMGMTINLGNYESARVDVGLVVPCYREEADEAFEWSKKWVNEKTLEEAGEARKFAKSRADDDPF